jgi:hypothetical protein
MVRYRLMEATSIEDMQLFGTPVSGHDEFDKNHYNQFITAGLSIMRMAEMNAKGVPLRIPKHEDVIEIYRSISLHISNWKNILKNSLNVKPELVEDLRKLDRLSVELYEHAKYNLIDDLEFNTMLDKKMGQVLSFTPDSFFRKKEEPADKDKDKFVERVAFGETNDMDLLFKKPRH